MTDLTRDPSPVGRPAAVAPDVLPRAGHPLVALGGGSRWVSTTDHKRIGILYVSSAFAFFLIGGLLASLMRTELAEPGLQLVNEQGYNQLFTMHGTIMLLLFGTPMAIGLGNYIVPLQIGADDMAFPRLNALSFWVFLVGAVIVMSSFVVQGGPPAIGWTGYAPLSDGPYEPTVGVDLWIAGLALTGISTIMGAINFVVTVYGRRAPGMTLFRMPIFTWNVLVTSLLILFAFPMFTAALAMLLIDRHLGGSFFLPQQGGSAVLWQHLFWFFGHPEVYILILPFFGIITEVISTFSRKPVFGYVAFVFATITIASLSMSVWAHHMFATGAVSNPFFSIASFGIAVPTGIKFFNWIATMWRGHLTFAAPMVWAIGFLYIFLLGGITGVIVASPPLDYHLTDTYFVVAHMHNVLIGGTVFATFAGIYYWFPKMTGRRLSEPLAKIHFGMWVVGFSLTFLPQYELGLLGMPRRIADYAAANGWTDLNLLSSAGAALLALGVVPFLIALGGAMRRPPDQPADPWRGATLEWWADSPPPPGNFRNLPPIRSARPVFDERLAATNEAPS